ncbi:type II toxin-antitoxin system RelE/ParE family toxin [Methyloversatilis sp.]|uniref:type II toxin-antitoxin system RelE/ParE family toxin n=1 Tax=Methyloversatilis sp. TaxID=2569862 RepID=UPI0035B1A453
MRVFKTRQFDKWARNEGVTDRTLWAAVIEMENGLIDTDLGGHVVKKRIALPGRGKRGGARSLLAYRLGDCAFFVYGFAKNERASIDDRELKALKLLASALLGWTPEQTGHALREGAVIEVIHD